MREPMWRSIALSIAVVLIVAGYFGPWAAHKDAGLILSADDLAEFVKFMPIVRSGEAGIMRELFFAPIWIGALSLALFFGRRENFGMKLFGGLLSVLFVFTPLPPFTFLVDAYRSPEFGATFWITAVALLGCVGLTIFGHRLPGRTEAIFWVLFGLVAASIAPLHFIKIQPEIEKLYTFTVGWGFFATVIGGGVLIAIGLGKLIGRGEAQLP